MQGAVPSRFAVLVASALLLASCASTPSGESLDRALLGGTIAEGFDCAMREVNERGFVVASVERASGFLRVAGRSAFPP